MVGVKGSSEGKLSFVCNTERVALSAMAAPTHTAGSTPEMVDLPVKPFVSGGWEALLGTEGLRTLINCLLGRTSEDSDLDGFLAGGGLHLLIDWSGTDSPYTVARYLVEILSIRASEGLSVHDDATTAVGQLFGQCAGALPTSESISFEDYFEENMQERFLDKVYDALRVDANTAPKRREDSLESLSDGAREYFKRHPDVHTYVSRFTSMDALGFQAACASMATRSPKCCGRSS